MNLEESYIARLQELAGLINEDRIDKLIAQKYPQEIIDFATNFAASTSKDDANVEKVRQNHYIPWIAQQAQLSPSIMKDKTKLNTIINWIKETGYNKISSNIPFEEVFKKAAKWLSSRNKNLETGQDIEGGEEIHRYKDNTRWIKVTNLNWCINAGEANGWCFNQEMHANKFVGKHGDRSGYVLLDEHNNPEIAVQYNNDTNIVEDIQGRFNNPVDPYLFPKVLDLFSKFKVITDINGHLDNFWNAYANANENLKTKFLHMPNVKLDIQVKKNRNLPIFPSDIEGMPISEKLKHKIPLNQDEINTLTVEEKLRHGYKLNDEEIAGLDPETKLHYNYPMTQKEKDSLSVFYKLQYKIPLKKKEIANLTWEEKINYGYLKNSERPFIPIHIKLDYDILLTARDLKKLNQPIREKVRKVAVRGYDYQDLFITNNNKPKDKNANLPIKDNYEGFDDYYLDEDAIHLKMTEEEYEEHYSGLNEYQQAYKFVDTNDSYFQNWDDEQKYMDRYLSNENMDKIKEMAKMFGVLHNYDFEKDGEVKRFIENNLSNSDKILEDYMIDLDNGMAAARKKDVEAALANIKFEYEGGYLDLPWKPLWEFLKDKDIEKFIDLKTMEINGEVDLESEYYGGHDITQEDLDGLNKTFERHLDEAEYTMAEHPDYIPNVQKFHGIINDLKFEQGNFQIYAPAHQGSAIYKKSLPKRDIYISNMDYVNQKAYVYIVDFSDKKRTKIAKRQKGWIHFDSIINYIQQYTLFNEADIRKAIQKILVEDYRYEYDRTGGFEPPIEVINTAQRALNAVEANKLVQSAGSNEGSGLQKAKSLVAKEPVTHAQLKRMKAFFDNNASLMARERAANRTVNDSAIVQSWELWGGDAGRTWAEREIRKTQSSNQTSKKVRNSDMVARDNRVMSTTNNRIHR